MTTKDLIKENQYNPCFDWRNKVVTVEAAEKMMVEYAKFHVGKALSRVASEHIDNILDWNPYSDNRPNFLSHRKLFELYPYENFK